MHPVSTITLERINLCLEFVRDYAYIVEDATPHLYLSALAQTPEILDTTAHLFTALPKVIRTSRGATDSSSPSVTYMTLHGHTEEIHSFEFSRDGRYVVTASRDKTVRVWDTQTYSQFGDPLTGHTDNVWSASFSPDGNLVVSASDDGTVRIWNAQSKAHEQVGESFTEHENVGQASFMPNGTHIVSVSHEMILFWDAVTHVETAQPRYDCGFAFSISPDGNCIVLPIKYNGDTLEIRAIQTGARIGQLLTGHYHSVSAVAFSPDDQHIVTSDYGGTLRTWDAKTGALINVMDATGYFTHIGFYLDERHFMTSGREAVRFWDMTTQSEIRQGTSREIDWFDFAVSSPNGDQIAASAEYSDSVRIWSFNPLIDTMNHSFELRSAFYSPDGKYIITACADNNVRIWDAETCSLVGNPLIGHSDKVNSASFSPDGRLIVTASDDKTVRVWNTETGAQIGKPLTRHKTKGVLASFSPDGTRFASADDDDIRVWSAERSDLGKLVRTIEVPSGRYRREHISFLPCGQLIAVDAILNSAIDNAPGYTQILDLSTGSEAAVVPHKYQDRYACFSPDEHFMLFFGTQDNDLNMWNAELHCVEKVLRGHTGGILRVSFSPDGKQIVSASRDVTIRIWSTETGSQTAVYQNWGKIHTLQVSPDGRCILSVYNDYKDRHIRIWAMPDSLPPGTDSSYSANNPNVRIWSFK